MKLTKEELISFVREQRKVFDIVRLVDVSMAAEYTISDTGELHAAPYTCFMTWKKSERCENCVSAKAFSQKGRLTKFEFVDHEVYFVVSIYTELDGVPYMTELVSKLNDDTLFGAYGKDNFAKTIEQHNEKLYTDTLTGAYNRRYYNEQLSNLAKINAIAMIDIDDFKNINDTFGHLTGDLVLQAIVKIMRENLRAVDAVVRFGGDEFIMMFQGISKQALEQRLENVRAAALALVVGNGSAVHASISIGAAYGAQQSAGLLDAADKALYLAKREKNNVNIVTV